MSNRIDELNAMLAPVVSDVGDGVFLWGVEFVPGARLSLLRLFVDAEGRPVTLDDCEKVSREVSAILDVNDPIPGNYNLEVSSPGLDRPLFRPEHFARFIGETAKVALLVPQDGRRRLQGRILGVQGEAITIADAAGDLAVQHGNIQKARIVPQFETASAASKKGKRSKPVVDNGDRSPSND